VRVVAHHIVPIWDGGGHELSNLVTLCDPCHTRRHVLISAERREARRQLKREFRWSGEAVAAMVMAALAVAWVIAAILVR
jgi:5-methylcytosine-specific restriction endonuclease McrA